MRPSNISRGRQILSRFHDLAEERLAHLTELYETGRWQLYFTRAELLDNVRDAKSAVDTWKLLVSTEALPNNRPVDLAWLDNGRPLPPRRHLLPEVEPQRLSARFTEPSRALETEPMASTAVASDLLPRVVAPIRIDGSPVPMPTPVLVSPPSAPRADRPAPPPWQNALDFTLMRERYSLLRKTG
ncbi:MAG: hypothetical protein JWR73_2722 [Tardiphaga sp.]|nr:hypothetical protein [Tardiphaga sp.]